jgi:protein required for attachment to host cells
VLEHGSLRVVAAPRFLGLLRQELPPELAQVVIDDTALDVVKLDRRSLTRRLFPPAAA